MSRLQLILTLSLLATSCAASSVAFRKVASADPLPSTLFHSLDTTCESGVKFKFKVLPETSQKNFWPNFTETAAVLGKEKLDAIVIPFSYPAGANLVLFAKHDTMNLVLARPTVFLMEEGRIREHESMIHPEETYQELVGHDLEESLLRKFAIAFAAKEDELTIPPVKKQARELCAERKFWRDYLVKRLERPDYAILIGASPEDDAAEATVSHEMLHAVFYTNPEVQVLVKDFWDKQVSEADKQAVEKILKDEGYDFDNNPKLLYNEFLAYLLEHPSDDMLLGAFRPTYSEKLRAYLVGRGIELP